MSAQTWVLTIVTPIAWVAALWYAWKQCAQSEDGQ